MVGVLSPFVLTPSRLRVRFRLRHYQASGMMSLSTVETAKDISGNSENSYILVQYVVLRRDLIDTWPVGSIVTQGCHASVSAIWTNKDDEHTVEYCSPSNLNSMHKARNPLAYGLIFSTVNVDCMHFLLSNYMNHFLDEISLGLRIHIVVSSAEKHIE